MVKSTEKRVTYEITATVSPELGDTYERYMIDKHIPDLLATGCFLSASLSSSEPGRYRIRYEARDEETLEHYLATFAPELRQDHAEHFPSGIANKREVWRVIGRLEA